MKVKNMDENKKIIKILVVMCSIFFIIVAYLTYLQVFQGKKLMENVYNRRNNEIEENTLRGSIFDRNGVVLAYSEKNGESYERIYPYGALYSHVIGYNSKIYGKSLLEANYNGDLLDLDNYSQVFGMIDRESKGNNIYLTLDHRLQELGENLLKDKKGAIVAIDPKKGEVLALVSKPNFDTNSKWLEGNWVSIVESDKALLLPRATQGLYPPGSIFKVITSMGAIENGLDKKTYEDKGKVIIDGYEIKNSGEKVLGNIDIKKALAASSNVVYSQIGVELGGSKLKRLADRIGMNQDISFDIPVNKSIFPYDTMGKNDMAAVAIGQGEILFTPFHMAMITAGIANNGKIMKPILVKSVVSSEEKKIKDVRSNTMYKIMDVETANVIKDMMHEAVENGTGVNAKIEGISVAGKTGTAENHLSEKNKGKEHAWFIGFAPVEDPKIAVAVLVENGGSGGGVSAPIAKEIISEYLQNILKH
jgi:peptidoglycan glycosyltransferase